MNAQIVPFCRRVQLTGKHPPGGGRLRFQIDDGARTSGGVCGLFTQRAEPYPV